MRPWLRIILWASGLSMLLGSAGTALAEEVRIRHQTIDLIGNLQSPGGKPLGADGAMLIIHGTLAHHGMEIIVGLQRALEAQGIASLAITLSLGVDAGRPLPEPPAGVLDHMAFSASDLPGVAAKLKSKGIKYDLRKQPDSGVWQLFCFDPSGARVELDFSPSEAAPA